MLLPGVKKIPTYNLISFFTVKTDNYQWPSVSSSVNNSESGGFFSYVTIRRIYHSIPNHPMRQDPLRGKLNFTVKSWGWWSQLKNDYLYVINFYNSIDFTSGGCQCGHKLSNDARARFLCRRQITKVIKNTDDGSRDIMYPWCFFLAFADIFATLYCNFSF